MKKILSCVLVIAIMASFMVSFKAETSDKLVIGDVTGEGKVTDADVIQTKRFISGWNVSIDENAADADRNGVVEDKDIIITKRVVSKWNIESFVGKEYHDPALTAEISGDATLQLGQTTAVTHRSTPETYGLPFGDAAATFYRLQSSDTSVIDVDGDQLKAKKMGSAVISVEYSSYYPSVDYTATDMASFEVTVVDSAAKIPVTENKATAYRIVSTISDTDPVRYFIDTVKENSGVTFAVKAESAGASAKEIVIGKGSAGEALGIDTSSLRDGGYVIRKSGEKLGVIGKDDSGVDRAVRYLLKYYSDENGDLAIPENMDIVDSEGQYVKNLTIAGNPIQEYSIRIPEEASENVQFSANELQKYIKRATGVEIPIASSVEQGAKVIELSPVASEDLGDEGFVIMTRDRNLYIAGGEKRGVMYGVSEFLEKYLGWRFMGEEYLYAYERENLDIPNGIYDKQLPVLEYRDTHGWQFRNDSDLTRMYTTKRKVNAHEDRASINNAQYGYALGTTWYHAHSFGYQIKQYYIDKFGRYDDGIFMTQPCLVEEESYQECMDSIRGLLDERIGGGQNIGEMITQISVAWNDNTNYAFCSKCRKVNKEETGENMGSGTYVRFVNRVAETVAEEYPGVEVFAIAYGDNYMRTPTKTAFNDNVIVCYCWNGCNNHTFGGGECGENTTRLGTSNVIDTEFFKGWAEKSNKMYSWYYCTNYAWYLAPLPIISNILPDIQHLADLGCVGIYAENRTGNNASSFEDLTTYLISQVEWNPYMSEKKYNSLRDEYLRVAYGDGWKELVEYIGMWEHAGDVMGCWVTNYEQPQNMLSLDYYAENYQKMCDLFDAAEAKADTAEQAAKIQKMRVHMEFLALSGLYNSMYANGSAAQKTEYTALYEALYQSVVEHDVKLGNGALPETKKVTGSPMKMWYDIEVPGDVE